MTSKSVAYINKYIDSDLTNKTIIITGGNSGIGLESAKICAYLKMHVIITVRSLEKGEQAIDEIKKEVSDANVEAMLLDVSNEESIKSFVQEIKDKKIDIDVFYHNAGVYHKPYQLVGNYDMIIGTNYFGPFITTSLLLDYLYNLPHPVKMVFTSSIAAKVESKVDQYLLKPTPKQSKALRYGNSKLLDAYLCKYLSEHVDKNVTYYLVHPGCTLTGLIKNSYPRFVSFAVGLFSNPIWKSSLSIVRALSNDAENGLFYGPSSFFYLRGYPTINKFLDKKYKDVDKVIEESEQISGYKLLPQE